MIVDMTDVEGRSYIGDAVASDVDGYALTADWAKESTKHKGP